MDENTSGRNWVRICLVICCMIAVIFSGALAPGIGVDGISGSPIDRALPGEAFPGTTGGGATANEFGTGSAGLGALNPSSATGVGGEIGLDNETFASQDTETHFIVESSQPAYWRTGAYGQYTGAGWQHKTDARSYNGNIEYDRGITRGERISYSVRLERPARAVPTAWRPQRVSGVNELSITDAQAVRTSDPLEPGTTFEGVSYAPPRDPSVLRTSDRTYPSNIQQRYTQLPEETPRRVGELTADIIPADSDPYQAAISVQEWLRTNKQYSLSASAQSEQIADTFLFEMDAGYCEYFATAMTVMLRSQDIPARYVVGYSTGDQIEDNTYEIRAMNAHAWVEVYFEGVGWIRFDPTPGDERLEAQQQQLNEQGQQYNPADSGSPGESFDPGEINRDQELEDAISRSQRDPGQDGDTAAGDNNQSTADGGADPGGSSETDRGGGTTEPEEDAGSSTGDSGESTSTTGEGSDDEAGEDSATRGGDSTDTGAEEGPNTGESGSTGSGTGDGTESSSEDGSDGTGDDSGTDSGEDSSGTGGDGTNTGESGDADGENEQNTGEDSGSSSDDTESGSESGDESNTADSEDDNAVDDSNEQDDETEQSGDDDSPEYKITLDQGQPVPGESIEVTVALDGAPVSDVEVLFNNDSVGLTDQQGRVEGVVPYADALRITVREPTRAQSETVPETVAGGGGQLSGVAARGRAISFVNSTETGALNSVRSSAAVQQNSTYEINTNASVSIIGQVLPGENIVVVATVEGAVVPEAEVTLDGTVVGETDQEGRANITLPDESGQIEINVSRGAVRGSTKITAPELSVTVDTGMVALPFSSATVTATYDDRPAAGLPVFLNGEQVATTGPDGTTVIRLSARESTVAVETANSRATTTVTGLLRTLVAIVVVLVCIVVVFFLVAYYFGYGPRQVLWSIPRLVRRGIQYGQWLLITTVSYAGVAVQRGIRQLRSALVDIGALIRTDVAPRTLLLNFRAWLRAQYLSIVALFNRQGADQVAGNANGESEEGTVAIREAWARFLSCLSLSRREMLTSTPDEIAKYAVENDELPERAVTHLRDAFRGVEYGPYDADTRLQRVQEAIEQIEHSLQEAEQTAEPTATDGGVE